MPSLNVVRDRLNTGIARGYGVLDWTALGLIAAERRDSTSPSSRLQLKIGSQGANMKNLFAIVFTVACATLSASASAQVLPQVPDLQTRIPAPLPPPPAPPTINGPMIQGAAPEVIAPSPLTTFSDRAGQCMQEGGGAGLNPSDLSAFTGACANAN
jgi:hypothetical protein